MDYQHAANDSNFEVCSSIDEAIIDYDPNNWSKYLFDYICDTVEVIAE